MVTKGWEGRVTFTTCSRFIAGYWSCDNQRCSAASAVKTLRKKYGHEKTYMFQPCDKNECGAYFQYKKQSTDQAMPKDLATQRQMCVEWMSRPSPMSTPYQSDHEDSFQNNDGGENEAVQGLLGMAATQTFYDADFGQVGEAEV